MRAKKGDEIFGPLQIIDCRPLGAAADGSRHVQAFSFSPAAVSPYGAQGTLAISRRRQSFAARCWPIAIKWTHSETSSGRLYRQSTPDRSDAGARNPHGTKAIPYQSGDLHRCTSASTALLLQEQSVSR